MNNFNSRDIEEVESPAIQIENVSGCTLLESFNEKQIKTQLVTLNISVSNSDIEDFQNSFPLFPQNLNPEFVGEDVLEQVVYTWKYLSGKFTKSTNKLKFNCGITAHAVVNACMDRLIEQIVEASENRRKLKNGRVGSLLKYDDQTLYLQEIPYYSFACSNVSLDKVQIGERSLRDIVGLCDNTNDEGEYMLPNSLGICMSMMAQNERNEPIIIGQVRNNAGTLTQRDNIKVVSSASGAVDISKGKVDLRLAGQEEVKEELGVDANIHRLPENLQNLFSGNNNHSLREIGVNLEDTDFQITGLCMEEKRMNPELLCIGRINKTINEIIKLWKSAESRDESLSIRGVTLQEIADNLSGEISTLDPHFIMSLLAWYNKVKV